MSDDVFLQTTVFLTYSSTVFLQTRLFKCPHIVSALRARLRLMMSTTTALRKGLCLVYDLWLCHCVRPKYEKQAHIRIHLSECEHIFDIQRLRKSPSTKNQIPMLDVSGGG